MVNGVLLRGVTGGAGEIDSMQVPGGRYGDQVDSDAIVALAASTASWRRPGWKRWRTRWRPAPKDARSCRTSLVGSPLGLANVVCVLDPELVLLSGGVAQAGGETLCELVSVELLKLVVPRTPV